MINGGISNPVGYSGQFDNGYYHSFTDNLPGQTNPNQFDKTISRTNMVNANHVPMDTWSNAYNPNALTSGAQKIHQAIVDNAYRTNTPVDFFSGAAPRSSGTRQHPAGQAIDVRLKDPVTGAFVGAEKIGSLAANPIGNLKPLMGRTDKVAKAIQGAIEKPYRTFATGVINSFMDNPGVYGDFENQRWGGAFGGPWGKDYMHYDEGKITSAVNEDQAALRKEAMNYNGVSSGTQLAGTPATAGSIGLAAAVTPTAPPQRPSEPSAPTYQSIPSPIGMAMLPQGAPSRALPPARIPDASTIVRGDPRVSMAPGSYPASSPPQTTIAGDPRVGMKLPNGLPSGPQQLSAAPSGASAAPSGPSTYNPQSAPEDNPVYSDNPMQGSQNPMQAGADLEAPEVTQKRASTYSKVGSAIGTVLLGPVGGVVLGKLGQQMGSTPQRVRSSIASNPQALQANVQSINQLAGQSGSKQDPNMRVTTQGLKDVLENPSKVTAAPEKYTTLEQMLAALAQGIDPATGKPIA